MRPTHLVFRDYFESLLVAIILALLLRTFVISGYQVSSSSMEPTLLAGDIILAYKVKYNLPRFFWDKEKSLQARQPGRGEVIIFRSPSHEGTVFVQRVIGLPGDRIEIKANKVFVNQKPLKYQESSLGHQIEIQGRSKRQVWLSKEQPVELSPTIVSPGKIFVLGDRRESRQEMTNSEPRYGETRYGETRYGGIVSIEDVLGEVFLVGFSRSRRGVQGQGSWDQMRWERLFHRIH